MKRTLKIRRTVALVVVVTGAAITLLLHPDLQQPMTQQPSANEGTGDAVAVLNQLKVSGRAPKTDYARTQFGDGWVTVNGCDTRNRILQRDLIDVRVNDECEVENGTLHDPYTGTVIPFQRGPDTSDDVQIDHVVALSDAWQKGAQQLTREQRIQLANDPLELLAVDGPTNQQKSDGDAATWLPPNKAFRCQYVARQIAVKKKYDLWVTVAEKAAMSYTLASCPGRALLK